MTCPLKSIKAIMNSLQAATREDSSDQRGGGTSSPAPVLRDDPLGDTVGQRMRDSERADKTHLDPVARDIRAHEYIRRQEALASNALEFSARTAQAALIALMLVAALIAIDTAFAHHAALTCGPC